MQFARNTEVRDGSSFLLAPGLWKNRPCVPEGGVGALRAGEVPFGSSLKKCKLLRQVYRWEKIKRVCIREVSGSGEWRRGRELGCWL